MNKLLESRLEQLAQQYEATEDYSVIQSIEQEFETYLQNNPHDSETLMTFAIFLSEEPTIADPERAIKYLEQLLVHDNNNIRALLVLTDLKFRFCGSLGDTLLNQLSNVKTNNNELMSMIEYAKTRDYDLRNKEQEYEACLVRSVNLCSKHVRNNEELAALYLNKGNNKKACELLEQALKNIACIFPEIYMYFNFKVFYFTTVDELIAEFITGTRTSYDHIKDLGESYVQCRSRISEQK